MRWKTSWFKKELFKQDFRLAGWVSLGYFLILLLTVVMGVYNRVSTATGEEMHYDYFSFNGFSLTGGLSQIFVIFLVPTLMAILLLRYLHKQDSSDFIYGLPISRLRLFSHHLIFGLVGLILPILLNGFLLVVIEKTADPFNLLTLTEINHWMQVSISVLVIVFSVSILVGMLTGVSLIQLVFTMIFLFLPVGFTLLVFFNLNYALPGLSLDYLAEEFVLVFSPITDIERLLYFESIDWTKILIYHVVSAIILIFSYFLYKKRPVEAANQAISFTWLRPIFIHSFTFCFTLIGGMYAGIFQYRTSMLFLTYFIFSIIGYYMSQMIAQKSWRVFSSYKSYLVYLVGMVLLIFLISIDITGYVNRVPKVENIQQAYVIDDVYHFNERQEYYGQVPGFTTEEDLETVIAFHQELIANSDRFDFVTNSYQRIRLLYQLKNGKEIVREYHLPYEDAYDTLAEHPIMTSSVFLQYSNPLFYIDEMDVNQIHFETGDYPPIRETIIRDREQIEALIEAYRQDEITHADRIQNAHSFTNTTIRSLFEQDVHLSLTIAHERVISLLEQYELLEQVMITLDDIDMIGVTSDEYDLYNNRSYFLNENPNVLYLVEDTASIQVIWEVLGQSRQDYHSERNYILSIFVENLEHPIVRWISEEAYENLVVN